jgi:lipopolysaccharide export system protein LptA
MMIKSVISAAILCTMMATSTVAQGTSVAFGGASRNKDAPVEVTADNLDVDQQSGTAIFTGNVVIGQGDLRLSAAKVRVINRPDGSGISRMIGSGGVTLVSGPDAAEARDADYDIDAGTIIMTGDVLLTQGASALTSDKMVVNLNDGTARMTGRVKTILQTGNN